jgi:hypothetical protein
VGGYGSGRSSTRYDLEACHLLEIGRLCDGRRKESHPRGTITWSDGDSGEVLAQASYAIAEVRFGDGVSRPVLDLHYRKAPMAPERRQPILLREERGGRQLAECPGCRRGVRKLYAPPTAEHFACRGCYRLVYRRRPKVEAQRQERVAAALEALLKADLRELLDPLFAAPRAAAAGRAHEALLESIAAELPLAPQELRLACLRLRREGLSLREIAALLESSKSSVQRYLAAGPGGLDLLALRDERRERLCLSYLPATPAAGDDPQALRTELKQVRRDLRRLGL